MRGRSKVLRPPGLLVFLVVVALIGVAWLLYADALVERGVEATGESLIGARVEVASVDLRPTDGSIRLTGLQVTNPDAPMTNLVEAGEIVVDLLLEPLLSKKVVVQDLVVTGVRFNTPRETSGALENPDPEAGQLWRNVNGWAADVRSSIPAFSLETLTGSVRTEGIRADSLRTVRYAREVANRADSLRDDWEGQLRALDPRPRIDSLRVTVQRLQSFRPTPLNALQLPGLIGDGRRSLADLTSLQTEVAALDDAVRAGIASLEIGPETVSRLRAEDLAYARGLLNIPSFEAPSLAPALFGGTALTWMKPVLFWAQTAERFLPPGLDPRRRPGPQRARAEGTTVEFPGRASYPDFLVERGQLGMEIGGQGLAAGAYTATIRGLTSEPSLYGSPMEISLGRSGGAQGPTGVSLTATLDHTGELLRDVASLTLTGVSLPGIPLEPLGGRLSLGSGEATFDFSREGERVEAELQWASTDLGWTRSDGGAGPAAAPQVGTVEWARELLWRTLTGVSQVELGMRLEGSLADPSLTVTSNLAEVIAASLSRELGEQIRQAEARLRAEVDGRIQPLLDDARGRVESVRTDVAALVATQRREVDELRAQLEARIDELVGAAPLGL